MSDTNETALDSDRGDLKQTNYVLLENPTRLSDSAIWSLQNSYFQNKGIEAWGSGDVPFIATTSP
ncbi:MAG TPA: hypothetical protein VMU77_00750, partial [Acidimicrobiales bacterium]|nr:hypothetical protein [Acidimicrobiales bacterium]